MTTPLLHSETLQMLSIHGRYTGKVKLYPDRLCFKGNDAAESFVTSIKWKRVARLTGEAGFSLIGADETRTFYPATDEALEAWLKALSPYVIHSNVEADYTTQSKLGKGTFGKVYKVRKNTTGALFAVKRI
jgi:serine/threonine protein kinase